MATYKGLIGMLAGLGLAITALGGVILNSPLMTMDPNLQRVYLWTLGFLIGVFLFGWGVAKFAGY